MRPSALERRDEIERRLAGRRPAVFLDYDGTLSPIALRPELATLPEETRQVLRRLAERYPVAILSGRAREDVTSLVGLEELAYAGSHGFDIAGPGFRYEVGEDIPARIERAAEELRRALAGLEGVLVEDKRFAVSIHFRLARQEDLPRIERIVDEVAARYPSLRKAHGKKLFELRPDLDWDKGRALLWLMDALGLDRAETIPLYAGDDVTDEDAFRVIEELEHGIGILVSEEPRPTVASYSLRDTEEVCRFLAWLAERKAPAPADVVIPGALARLRTGEVNLLGPFEVPGLAPRRVRVYLPRGYTPERPWPAFFMFDGQNMFDDAPSFCGGWHLHEAVERLARAGRPVPVAIGIDHGGPERIQELSPFELVDEPGQADLLLDWITGSLMPILSAELNLQPGPQGAVIGGSSMGGLCALWSHFHYPRAFGGALVMSPSFWVADRAIFTDIAAQPTPLVSRIYLDAGRREGKGRLLPVVAAMAIHLAGRGYDGDHLMWRPDAKGSHNEASWRRRLPKALRFLYR